MKNLVFKVLRGFFYFLGFLFIIIIVSTIHDGGNLIYGMFGLFFGASILPYSFKKINNLITKQFKNISKTRFTIYYILIVFFGYFLSFGLLSGSISSNQIREKQLVENNPKLSVESNKGIDNITKDEEQKKIELQKERIVIEDKRIEEEKQKMISEQIQKEELLKKETTQNNQLYEMIGTNHNQSVENFYFLLKKYDHTVVGLQRIVDEIRANYCTKSCNVELYDNILVRDLVKKYPLSDKEYLKVADVFVASSSFDSNEVWIYPFQDSKYKDLGGKNFKKKNIK